MKGCPWVNYEEHEDWGYYSRTNGDCLTCQDQCSTDDNCGAIECGEDYCSWWKVGKCSIDEEFVAVYNTCHKGKLNKLKCP